MKAQQIINRLSAHYLKEGYSQNLGYTRSIDYVTTIASTCTCIASMVSKVQSKVIGYNCPVIEQSILRDVDGRKAVMTMC